MAKFNSLEELLALRPKTNKPIKESINVERTNTNSDVDVDKSNIKTYKFKQVKNSTCGWEVDYD